MQPFLQPLLERDAAYPKGYRTVVSEKYPDLKVSIVSKNGKHSLVLWHAEQAIAVTHITDKNPGFHRLVNYASNQLVNASAQLYGATKQRVKAYFHYERKAFNADYVLATTECEHPPRYSHTTFPF